MDEMDVGHDPSFVIATYNQVKFSFYNSYSRL